jgi:hypothetical protein
MKLKSRLATLLVASASVLAVYSASAATYTAGDMLLGFRATGGTGLTTDYIINLGSSTTIRDASVGTSLGTYGTDLVATFGAGWATRSDLSWGLITERQAFSTFGNSLVNGDPGGTLYASTTSPISKAQINSGGNTYLGMAGQFGSLAASGNASNASFSLSTDSNPQIWSAQMSGVGSSFNGNLPAIEQSLSSGNTIGVYRFLSTTTGDTYGGSVGTAKLVNTLGINAATGAISVIPEPSTALLGPLGALFLLRRRRTNA